MENWRAGARLLRASSRRLNSKCRYPRPTRRHPAPARSQPWTAILSRLAQYGGATTACRRVRGRKPSDPQIDTPGDPPPPGDSLYQLPHWEPEVRHNRGRQALRRYPMTDPFDLVRFLEAQEPVFRAVLTELGQGRKQSHWMWFVFP